jgi:hypothetical protein
MWPSTRNQSQIILIRLLSGKRKGKKLRGRESLPFERALSTLPGVITSLNGSIKSERCLQSAGFLSMSTVGGEVRRRGKRSEGKKKLQKLLRRLAGPHCKNCPHKYFSADK